MAYCSGLCNRFRARRPVGTRLRYAAGDKFCCYCGLFMRCPSGNCPCCNTRLRRGRARRWMVKSAGGRVA